MISQKRLKQLFDYSPSLGSFNRRDTGEVVGTINKRQYKIYADGKFYAARDLAWLYMTGDLPTRKNPVVFKNGERFDTSFGNLCLKSDLKTRKCESNTHKSCGRVLPLLDFPYKADGSTNGSLCIGCVNKAAATRRANKNKITLEIVKKSLTYNSATGELIYKKTGDVAGSLMSNGYIEVSIRSIRFLAHRLIWWLVTGHKPNKDEQIDHINHIRDDNRWENLRLVDGTTNSQNQKLRADNTSGVAGVAYTKNRDTWQASIHVNGELVYLGSYRKFEDAVRVRKKAERQYNFHPNHGKE